MEGVSTGTAQADPDTYGRKAETMNTTAENLAHEVIDSTADPVYARKAMDEATIISTERGPLRAVIALPAAPDAPQATITLHVAVDLDPEAPTPRACLAFIQVAHDGTTSLVALPSGHALSATAVPNIIGVYSATRR
ncbi:hypothetical protein [Kocuria palustris]|uniref:hypothetical protein n=1 Tax=Kocuria palustris TaxID=71999 RepID=UPI0020443E6C|nr:hypothetical protein [Kocuria palustris]MCM3332810.1 hypothetical protein [Kocuria palustris]